MAMRKALSCFALPMALPHVARGPPKKRLASASEQHKLTIILRR